MNVFIGTFLSLRSKVDVCKIFDRNKQNLCLSQICNKEKKTPISATTLLTIIVKRQENVFLISLEKEELNMYVCSFGNRYYMIKIIGFLPNKHLDKRDLLKKLNVTKMPS
jgi:hypothetical protein